MWMSPEERQESIDEFFAACRAEAEEREPDLLPALVVWADGQGFPVVRIAVTAPQPLTDEQTLSILKLAVRLMEKKGD